VKRMREEYSVRPYDVAGERGEVRKAVEICPERWRKEVSGAKRERRRREERRTRLN
jgi:hypothetical protein